MSGMAEVLLRCSPLDLKQSLHVAKELEAAGFGDVREAKAQALYEAADVYAIRHHGNWLRSRAAAVRGEG